MCVGGEGVYFDQWLAGKLTVCFVNYCVSFYVVCLDRIENQQVVEYVIQVK